MYTYILASGRKENQAQEESKQCTGLPQALSGCCFDVWIVTAYSEDDNFFFFFFRLHFPMEFEDFCYLNLSISKWINFKD